MKQTAVRYVTSRNCPNIAQCEMFKYFKRYAKEVYQELYCKSEFQTCERYKRKEAGEPVP